MYICEVVSFSIFQLKFCHFLAKPKLKDTREKFLNHYNTMIKAHIMQAI
jgi:hypothetical protein